MKASRYEQRVCLIKEAVSLVEYVREEVELCAAPVSSIFRSAAKRNGLCDSTLVKSLIENGVLTDKAETAFMKAIGSLKTEPPERDVLLSFGACVGKSGGSSQVTLCITTVERLERILTAAEDECANMSRMWTSLGAIGGAFAVIALI